MKYTTELMQTKTDKKIKDIPSEGILLSSNEHVLNIVWNIIELYSSS